jgi:hypothetical protein
MDINKLLNIGNESAGYEAPQSLLDEMMEEIGIESDIDNAVFDAEAAAITAAASIAENVYVAMAEKECSMEGANPLEVYKDFGIESNLVEVVGQEAIRDVVARRAYSGLAQVKSLINTIISWLKRILGLATNTKKIFKSLANKAKKIRKEVTQARAKFTSKSVKNGSDEEIEKELPNYMGTDGTNLNQPAGLLNVINVYNRVRDLIVSTTTNVEAVLTGTTHNPGTTGTVAVNGNPVALGGGTAPSTTPARATVTTGANNNRNPISRREDAEALRIFNNDVKQQWIDKLKDWKEDTAQDYRDTALFSHIDQALAELYRHRTGMRDIDKDVDRGIKALERARKEMERTYTQLNANDRADRAGARDTGNEILSELINNLTNAAGFMNLFAKFYVKVADELFTDAKWLIAKAL